MTIGIVNIILGALIILMSIPLVLGSVEMNHGYGVRIKKAFESEENWYKINKFGGKKLIFWSAIMIIVGTITLFIHFVNNTLLFIAFACAPIIIMIPCILEIYNYARKL